MRLDALSFCGPLAEAEFTHLLAQASPERRARIARFRRWEDAHRALLGELLVRAVAAERLGIALADVRLGTEPEGKPFVTDHPDFHVNLAHGGGWVVCASGPWPVGVDIEPVAPVPAELPPEACTPGERLALEGPGCEARFARLWTAKEACAKALGVGLGLDFRSLEVCFRGDGFQLVREGHPLDGLGTRSFAPDAAHWGAVCVLGGPAPAAIQARDLAWLRRAAGAGP